MSCLILQVFYSDFAILDYSTPMNSLKIAESKAMHKKITQEVRMSENFQLWLISINLQGSPNVIQSPEEASRLLAKAMEHERWSCTYKDFATLQLERAQEDTQSTEDQLKSAEGYTCSIIHSIRRLGFTIKFIDAHTAAVAKIHDSMFWNILYSNLWTTHVFIRNSYHLGVRFSCHLFATWLNCIYAMLSFPSCHFFYLPPTEVFTLPHIFWWTLAGHPLESTPENTNFQCWKLVKISGDCPAGQPVQWTVPMEFPVDNHWK